MGEGLGRRLGPGAGARNRWRFRDAGYDERSRRIQALPDGPERLAQLREALRIVAAYAPQKYNVHRIVTYLVQPRLLGFRAPLYGNQFWQYVDIDETRSTRR